MEGALLLVLFTLAASLEDLVTLKAKSTLCAIGEIAPTKAYIVEQGGQLVERAVDDVKVHEMIAVRAGEIVPLDGVIRKGEASLSMAHMTGESLPICVGVSQSIASGARVLDGSIEVEVLVSSHDSTVAKLIRLITRAHSSKPKLSQTFDRYGRMYALCVIGITFFLLFFLSPRFADSFLWQRGGRDPFDQLSYHGLPLRSYLSGSYHVFECSWSFSAQRGNSKGEHGHRSPVELRGSGL